MGKHTLETSPEELAAKYGYSLEQAKRMMEIMRGASRQQKPLNLRTFRHAQMYHESASILGKHIEGSDNANVAPGVVLCLSFSLELFFKALVLLDRDDIHDISELTRDERDRLSTHSIPLLYDQIPARHKDRLSDIYGARMGVPRLAQGKFRSELVEEANNIFLSWRYAYEKVTNQVLHLNVKLIDNLIVSAQLVAVEAKRKDEPG